MLLYYSVDPLRGDVVVFPAWASKELHGAKEAGQATHVFGERFFGVTVHFGTPSSDRDACHHQTTTNGGLRSVGCVRLPPAAARTFEVTVVRTASKYGRLGGYRLPGTALEETDDSTAITRTGTVPAEYYSDAAEDQVVAQWEWCRTTPGKLQALKQAGELDAGTTLRRLDDSHWFAYDEATNAAIEAAWEARAASVCVSVGVRTFDVAFGSDRVFAKQSDGGRVREVRRNQLSAADVARKQAAAEAVQVRVEAGDVCPLCFDAYTPFMERVELGGCKHVFHRACIHANVLHAMQAGGELCTHHCPTCRAAFSKAEYESWSGDTVSLITSGYGR